MDRGKDLVRPGSAYMQVTEFGPVGRMNPTPSAQEDSDTVSELCLSPEKLKSITKTEDLNSVTTLELCVDLKEETLGNFGAYLPSLVQLRLNNSWICSVRDLGTDLSHLQVLWLTRCGLSDLDGIHSVSSLKELYVAYNNISDLNQIAMLEYLEVLDLEGNNIDNLIQVQYLGLCSHLRTLTLEGNPLCSRPHPEAAEPGEYRYHLAVRELIPQLCYLDNVSADEDLPGCCSNTDEDLVMLKESIKQSTPITTQDYSEESVGSSSRPSSAQRPSLLPSNRPSSARPLSSSDSASRPGSAESDLACSLTHGFPGSGQIQICGNPVKALRAHRQRVKVPFHGALYNCNMPHSPIHVPEHTYDLEGSVNQNRNNVFAELRAWRKEHDKRLEAIEKDQQPQVMTIHHNENEFEEDNEEASDCGLSSDQDGEEMVGVEARTNTSCKAWKGTESPDSSFVSLSPDLSEQDVLSPDMSRISLTSDINLSPSPPLAAVPPSGARRISEIRARRLRLTQPQVTFLKPAGDAPVKDTAAERPHPSLDRTKVGSTRDVFGRSTYKPCRPASSPVAPGQRAQYSGAVGISPLSVTERQPIICSNTPKRPHTARAALQRPSILYPVLPKTANHHPD
ncbi:leucine-rich repeat-containing protein 56 [Denticeps clupeoides]|uniref:Leucine-rich repeat-containing protein 56 n=1 Tax=Denticeps clupeoides TaxID=299321 RepID=A0AAY4D0A8_9TELE|nr:leucine-rich repeat-containing protein 56 [Denticeps clupeoides]